MCITRALCGPEIGTDHHVTRCELKASVHTPRRTGVKPQKKLDVNRPKTAQTREDLDNKFSTNYREKPIDSAGTKWISYKNCLYTQAKEVLGHPKQRNTDWFEDSDDKISDLIK